MHGMLYKKQSGASDLSPNEYFAEYFAGYFAEWKKRAKLRTAGGPEFCTIVITHTRFQ